MSKLILVSISYDDDMRKSLNNHKAGPIPSSPLTDISHWAGVEAIESVRERERTKESESLNTTIQMEMTDDR